MVPLCLVDKFESHCWDHSVWQAALRRMYAAKADQVLPNIRAARTVCSSFFRKRSPFILIRFLDWIHWTETNKKEQTMHVHFNLSDIYSRLDNDALITFTQHMVLIFLRLLVNFLAALFSCSINQLLFSNHFLFSFISLFSSSFNYSCRHTSNNRNWAYLYTFHPTKQRSFFGHTSCWIGWNKNGLLTFRPKKI